MSCTFDEDAYRDQQLDKHLAEQEMGEYMHDVHMAYEEDRADAQRDLERERDCE